MKELVFLLEEPSAAAMLQSLLPRVLARETPFRLIPFQGKQDLDRQLERRLRHYLNPQARFIVLRDQDSAPDCKALKSELEATCRKAKRKAVTLVRIACRELETFYLADLTAVERALELTGLARQQNRAKFRAPDKLGNPSQQLKELTKHQYQKVSGSRQIGLHLDPKNGRSTSFKNLVEGIQRMERALHEK